MADTLISIAIGLFVALVGYIYLREQSRTERRLDTVERTVTRDRHHVKNFETWVRLTFERLRPGLMKDFPERPTDEE